MTSRRPPLRRLPLRRLPLRGRPLRGAGSLSVCAVAVGCGLPTGSFGSAADLAEAAGCADSFEEAAGMTVPGDVGACEVDGEEVTLVVADDPAAVVTVAEELAAALSSGGVSSATGDGWAVLAEDRSVVDEVVDRLE